MKVQLPKDIECKKVAWTIKDFSKMRPNELHSSEVFTISNTAWQFLIRFREENVNYFSVFLKVANAANLPEGWSIYAEFSLIVVSQVSRELSVKGELKHQFCAKQVDWGFPSFMPLNKLRNPQSGYIMNDKCIVEAEFFVLRYDKIGAEPTNSHLATPTGELVDFRDLGQIEKTFIPLLDEVCSWHPSLVQCQKKRTYRFTEWAFTALGRVLQFLKTKKAKDMTEEACEQLQQLWEELETFGFDLVWLEPHVRFALRVKEYKEKAKNVQKLKEDLVVLEAEIKRLREKLVDTEENVENVRKELVKEEEGSEERDMDAEIGYGKP